MEARLPAHLEVAALIRLAQAEGGFASVLHRGEREGGTILLVLTERGGNARVFERMPSMDAGTDGGRKWQLSMAEDIDNKDKFYSYLDRRAAQDPDLWIIELDVAGGERLIGLPPTIS